MKRCYLMLFTKLDYSLSLSQFWNSKRLQSLLRKSLSFCIEALLLITHDYAVLMLNN
jgi:hypothetical protein